jgi:hypothetical protein
MDNHVHEYPIRVDQALKLLYLLLKKNVFNVWKVWAHNLMEGVNVLIKLALSLGLCQFFRISLSEIWNLLALTLVEAYLLVVDWVRLITIRHLWSLFDTLTVYKECILQMIKVKHLRLKLFNLALHISIFVWLFKSGLIFLILTVNPTQNLKCTLAERTGVLFLVRLTAASLVELLLNKAWKWIVACRSQQNCVIKVLSLVHVLFKGFVLKWVD